MTAVANPPSFQQINRSAWGASGQGGLNAMNADEVARMFMPRKSAQRSNSSSSISSTSSSSSTTTIPQSAPQPNGVAMSPSGDLAWSTGGARKKVQRTGPWPTSKGEGMNGVASARPPSILTTNGGSAPSSMTSLHPSPIVPSQHLQQSPTQQHNGVRASAQPIGEGNPVLYLLSMNGTFERKTISVPYYPETLRIGRQTNAKTVPTPANGFFDSKVLSRQHAELWADRNGKIWIRDVKSSNGTFVNGTRLSAENRDSEPHELQTQDQLELGIDIVSEDQKTVVHHKVAAKVEHAGFLGPSTNVLDMNFGDLDPANGALMLPSPGSVPMRGRTGSQGSIGSNGRMGASVAGSHMSMISQQRPMNFWLTPVTTEQIAKRISQEMRTARLQASDLGHADMFFGSLLSKEDVKNDEKALITEPAKSLLNGGSLPYRSDKSRFSDPPAPPPQQPLPEKPDISRSHVFDPASPSLKRTTTERPSSVSNGSPIRHEPASQIVSLVEALAAARKDLDAQSARMRDLEEMLQQERQAREMAEELARQLELQSSQTRVNCVKSDEEGSILEEAFEPPTEEIETRSRGDIDSGSRHGKPVDPRAISHSTIVLEQRLENMVAEIKDLKGHMETFKKRAETAEAERDADSKTLAEMVEKIRTDEARQKSTATRSGSLSDEAHDLLGEGSEAFTAKLGPLLQKAGLSNGLAHTPVGSSGNGQATTGTLSRPPEGQSLAYHSAPYASMIGVVLVGMGLMAYLNGWQPPKVDR